MNTPHFLRFARSIALGAGVLVAGCGSSTSPDASSPDVSSPSDVSQMDSAAPSDANACASCYCTGLVPPDAQIDSGNTLPECTGPLTACCAAVGPLPPPELSV
jgi:hypothetical protein